MASKLFHAIVAIGVSLGTACSGKVDVDPGAPQREDASPDVTRDTSTEDAPAPVDAGTDAAQDAAQDAPADVPPDAFCDAAWPTTKGSPPLPACINPNKECKDEEVFPCAPVIDDKTCQGDSTKWTASVCVNKTWTCAPGRRAERDCRCWSGPNGVTCRDGS